MYRPIQGVLELQSFYGVPKKTKSYEFVDVFSIKLNCIKFFFLLKY